MYSEFPVNTKNTTGQVMMLIEYDAGHIDPSDDKNKKIVREFQMLEHGQIPDRLVVYVVLQKYNVKNRNGRIYPERILRVQNEAYQEAIRQRRAVGELDHPESSVISGERVSHNIIKTWWEGHTLVGEMEILMTKGYQQSGIVSTSGDKVAELLRHNIMIGVSSRGLGSLKEENGSFIVQDDFEIICWDVVTAPSTPGSWIFKDRAEAAPFVENYVKKGQNLNEGLDKFLLD